VIVEVDLVEKTNGELARALSGLLFSPDHEEHDDRPDNDAADEAA
jgi:hypothetical protein